MLNIEGIRDFCVEGLERELGEVVVSIAKIDGQLVAGADISIKEQEGTEIYRIVVIKHAN